MVMVPRPEATEFAPFYARYIDGVPDGDLLSILQAQLNQVLTFARGLPEQRGGHRYAPGKWSIREVLGHLADSERIFAYRALRIARGDATPLSGFDENPYVQAGRFDERTLADLSDEYEAVRRATLHLFRHLDDEALARRGTANGAGISVRALGWIIAGHERHHLGMLRGVYTDE
jgi:uncharacterized damage-inducible protein DinB